ncbi:MAG: DUF2911 domain-containing protein [Filimonas sp.]|nr:DUF2911 domain-containing protein [Filimonas sp.]
MKKVISIFALLAVVFTLSANAQKDKSKRPSPPDSVAQTIKSGALVSINYSKPSLKGRTIGKDVEPMQGKVWRAGANEITVFSTSKDVKVEGQALPAGKYGLYVLNDGKDYWVIFNKVWNDWGTNYDKYKDQDVLKAKAKAKKADKAADVLTYTIDKNGKVDLWWGDLDLEFSVK